MTDEKMYEIHSDPHLTIKTSRNPEAPSFGGVDMDDWEKVAKELDDSHYDEKATEEELYFESLVKGPKVKSVKKTKFRNQ